MAFDNDTQLLIYEFNGGVGDRKKYVGLGRTSMRVASVLAFKFCLWPLKTPISLVKYVRMCHIPLPPLPLNVATLVPSIARPSKHVLSTPK